MSTGVCWNAAMVKQLSRHGCGRRAWTKPTPVPDRLPSISPALLRQLAGMGNSLSQIARQVNAGGGENGIDRVRVIRFADGHRCRTRAACGTRCWKRGLTMIVKFHPRGRGSGAGPVDYLLRKRPPARRRHRSAGKPEKSGELIDASRPMQKIHLRRAVFFRTGLTARPA